MEIFNPKKDYCTWFPERVWGVSIKFCCFKHDENLGTHDFYKCLSKRIDMFSAALITLGGAIGGWVRYTKIMLRKV